MSRIPEIESADQIAMFLDFDGTLVNIVERPDLVQIPAGLPAALQATHVRLAGALALITGRSIADLDRLLTPLRLPTAGVHGLEYRDNSGVVRSDRMPTIPVDIRERLTALANIDPGLILEDKGVSLAMHFRQAPGTEALIRETFDEIGATLGEKFFIQHGKMVIELRPGGVSKGTAVQKFMSAPPFAGRRPIFIGDDITDEDAFEVVNKMLGYSVRVGSAIEGSAARYLLPDVPAVQDWICSAGLEPNV